MWLLSTTGAADSKYDRRDAYFFATDSTSDDLLAQLLVNDSIQEKNETGLVPAESRIKESGTQLTNYYTN